MWDWLKQSNNLKATGTLMGGIGSLYGAYTGYKTAKEQNAIAKSQLALQKASYDRGVAKEDEAQIGLDSAINSVWGNPKKKKTASMTI